MHHHMEVSLTPRRGTPLLEYKSRSIGQRLWRRLFGKHKIVILFPAESVDMVTIIEQPSSGAGGTIPG